MRMTKAQEILYSIAVALILASALVIESRIKTGVIMTAIAGACILAAQIFQRKEARTWRTK